MADRVVKISLVAQVTNYVKNMEAAQKSTKKVEDSLEAQKKASIEAAKAQGEAAKKIGASLMAIGAVAAVAVGLAVKKFADFDQAMSNVKAATQETAENMGLLRDAALVAGADTVFSATEAANAIEELGKAGLSTADILGGGLDGALSLAAAGGLGVAEAAGIAATALKTFELKGSDMSHVADLMAAGAGKAMGDVTDLAGALAQAGLVAATTGISIEETTGTLSAFASKGLLGSDAGTSFKSMLQRLTPQSKEAADAMKAAGISAYDAQGNFIGMSQFAGNLQSSLKGLTTEQRNSTLATIFGSDAVRAANVLYTEGADGIAEWTGKVDDTGYAAKVARDRLNNLAGDVEALGGSFDTALIKTGSGANDMLRGMTQSLTGLVNGFAAADPIVQQVTLGLGLTIGAIALTGGAAMIAVPKLVALKATFADLNMKMGKTALIGGGVGLALTALVTIIAAVGQANADAAAKTKAYGDTVDAVTGKITNSTREMAKTNLGARSSFLWMENQSAYEAATKLGISLETITDAATGNVKALAEVKKATEGASLSSREAIKIRQKLGLTEAEYLAATKAVRDGVKGESSSIEEATRVAKEKQRVDGESVDANGELAGSYDKVTEAVDGTITSVKDLAKELDAANGVNLSAREAARNLESAYDDFDASLKKNGRTLDITTEKGRENQDALDAIAEAAAVSGQAIVDADGTWVDYKASLEASRAEIDERIAKLGITGQAAEDMADDILKIPTESEWKLFADTEAAAIRLQRIQDLINGINSTSGEHISTGAGGMGGMTRDADGSVKDYYANGGLRENHVAQIAPAGAWRMWAEPETGGEAYIPLAQSKRARSLDIWEETGKRLGVAGYANGYVSPVQYVPSGGSYGGGGGSTTNNRRDTTWQITSTGVDPAELAAKIDGQVAWRERSGF